MRVTLYPALVAASAAVGGCFSLSAVPPADGLPAMDEAGMRCTTSFLASAGPEVESEWKEKAILIHPLLDGHDVGWFILDTGASGWTITSKAAKEAGLPAVGWSGMQGRDRTTVYRCGRVQVGDLALDALPLAGLELRHASAAFGRDIAGVCGRELFLAAIVELDGPGRRVRLLDPATFRSGRPLDWQPLTFDRNLPHLTCRYADTEGSFLLDTGCDQAVFVSGPAADQHDLRRYATGEHKTLVMYGLRRTVDVAVLPSFAIDGREFGPVPAVLGPPDDAARSVLPGADGVVGLPLFGNSILYLDLGRSRVAIEPRSGADG